MSKGSKFIQALRELDWDEEDKLEAYHDFHDANVRTKQNKSAFSKIADRIQSYVKSSKGFGTKEGGFINYHEWHAAGMGFLLIDLSYRMQKGIFFLAYVSVLLKILIDEHKNCKDGFCYLYTEIGKNLHYYVLAGFLAVVLWQMSGGSLPEINQSILSAILSALLGL